MITSGGTCRGRGKIITCFLRSSPSSIDEVREVCYTYSKIRGGGGRRELGDPPRCATEYGNLN